MANEFIIVGTAGHVDHGKTELVKALTGQDTDRLKEEKQRGISIELGFAPLELPNGRKLGLVDVPGHERFIRQMLAGVGGMDLVILVVAADEGVMPQTIEHLEIVDLLRIKKGLIVLTKKDLVDEEWVEMVKEDVLDTVAGTVLEEAPLIAVSSLTGEGIGELISQLQLLAEVTVPRDDGGAVRFPVDRVFSMTGFGTVVTGTIWSGNVAAGDTLEILPTGSEVRVRGLQVHGDTVSKAFAGQRAAINLSGIDVEEIPRGSWLAKPGYLQPSRYLDAEFYLLKSSDKPLANRQRVRFYLGTSEAFGRVVLLDRDQLEPGESCLVELAMEEEVTARRGDRFVLRNYSPMYTIGGGSIIEPVAAKHKRFAAKILQELEAKLKGSPEEIIGNYLGQKTIVASSQIAKELGLEGETLREELQKLTAKGEADTIQTENETVYASRKFLNTSWKELEEELSKFHQRYPLRAGLPKEELRTRFFSKVDAKYYNGLLHKWAGEKKIGLNENFVALGDFSPKPNSQQKELLDQINDYYLKELFQPPGWEEIEQQYKLKPDLSREMMHYMVQTNKLVKTGDILYHREAVDQAKMKIAEAIKQSGSLSLAEVRDLLDSSRKYILPLLEYLDQTKFTKRIEDKRILYKR